MATAGPNVRAHELPPVRTSTTRTRTAAGAGAFARFFSATIDWGYATNSPAYMRHYFAASCAVCRQVAGTIERTALAGRHLKGGRVSVVSVSRARAERTGRSAVVRLSVQAAEVADAQGRIVERFPALPDVSDRIYVRWTGGDWVVLRMTAAPGGTTGA